MRAPAVRARSGRSAPPLARALAAGGRTRAVAKSGATACATVCATVWVAAACASGGAAAPAAGPATAPPTTAPPAVAVASGRPAVFTWAPAPVVRRLEVRTDVEIVEEAAGAPGGESPERVRTVVALADTVSAGTAPGAVRATGVVESFAVTASARVQGAQGAPPFTPFAYRAFSDARGVRVDPAPGTPPVDLRCTASGGATALGALAAVRETLPHVPAAAAAGARWRDTTVSAACAGPVLLVVQTASHYEAAAGEGGALAVVRRSTTTMRGQGAAGVRPVAVSATGAGETRYLLDPGRGTVLAATGASRATLTVTVAGAARRYAQHARTQITAP